MATPIVDTGLALRLERTYKAAPDRVFDAWVQPEAIAQWFAPSKEFETVVTALEVRVGGRYRIEMRHPSGKVHVVGGVYQELARPAKLVMTWAWEGQEELGHTMVTVEITPLATGTRLVLIHERFPNDPARVEHNKGWTGCLDRLGPFVEATQ
jgi:uncharacterized protein YndB with AHSA1/START domain